MTVKEVGKALGVSKTTVLNGVHEGTIPSIRFGERVIRIPRKAFLDMLNNAGKRESSELD